MSELGGVESNTVSLRTRGTLHISMISMDKRLLIRYAIKDENVQVRMDD